MSVSGEALPYLPGFPRWHSARGAFLAVKILLSFSIERGELKSLLCPALVSFSWHHCLSSPSPPLFGSQLQSCCYVTWAFHFRAFQEITSAPFPPCLSCFQGEFGAFGQEGSADFPGRVRAAVPGRPGPAQQQDEVPARGVWGSRPGTAPWDMGWARGASRNPPAAARASDLREAPCAC